MLFSDHIAGEYIHTDTTTYIIGDPQRLELSAIVYFVAGDGDRGQGLKHVLLDSNPRPLILKTIIYSDIANDVILF